MYQWICQKCGEQNRSSQNVCRNAACRFVFHETKTQQVKCGKCQKVPVGSTLFRKGRNTTFPLKRLSAKELSHPDYLVYGEVGLKFLNALRPYVGRYLCQSCHPETIGLKIDSGLVSEYEIPSDMPDAERLHVRIKDDRNAYDRVAKDIREKIRKIKAANPEMTEVEEVELARRLMRRIKDDEFIVDKLDWQLRRIVRGAIASKVSFRKNISKDRIYEKLYRYWRIEEARQGHDVSHLRKVLRQEARHAAEIGGEIIEDARKGPDLFSTIEELTRIMAEKSDEIALREHRIRSESRMAHKLDLRMTVLYGRIGKLERAIHDTNDPDYLAKAGPVLTRLRNRYFRVTEDAQRYLTPIGIEMEREIIRKMQKRFFSHYSPLLNVARNIIFWDIKEDLWKGPDGLSPEEKDQAGYGKFYGMELQRDRVQFGRVKGRRPYQDVVFPGHPAVNEKKADKVAADEILTEKRGIEYGQILDELAPLGVFSAVHCEVCDRFTTTPRMIFGVNAVRRIDVLTGQDMRPKVEDFTSKEAVKGIDKDDRKMIAKMDLVVCPDCQNASSLKDLAKAQAERAARLQTEWQEKVVEAKAEKDRLALQRKYSARAYTAWLTDALYGAREELRKIGIKYTAPILKVDLRVGGKIKLLLITVPEYGKAMPETIEKNGWPVEILQSLPASFQMNYAYHAMSPKDLSKWSTSAKRKQVKLTRLGIVTGMNHLIMGIKDVATYLDVEIPVFPMGYWKGIHMLGGDKEVHPNFRDIVYAGNEFDFEPMHPYGKPTEAEIARQKAIQLDKSRRRTEERKFWDALRTRGRGGPSPKTIPVANRPPAREDRRGFHKETPMPLLPSGLERIRKSDPSFELKGWEIKDPATKDTKDFLMLPPPATPEKGTRHSVTEKEVKDFYRQKFQGGGAKYTCKGVSEGEDGENAKFSKKLQQECDEKFRRLNRKTFQRVRLPKKK